MRTNGMSLHKLPLFVWSIFVTAVLLLLALPVLAGGFAPALNLAICWKLLYIKITQSAGNFLDLNLLSILRDYTPSFICYKNSTLLVMLSSKRKLQYKFYSVTAKQEIDSIKEDNKEKDNSNFNNCTQQRKIR
jgi:hypothetical protein